MVTYADLRDKSTAEDVSNFLLNKGFSKEAIMKNEFAYLKANGLIQYPQRQGSSFQDWMLKHEIKPQEVYESIERSAIGYKKAIGEGFANSNVGILVNEKVPQEQSEDLTAGQEIARGVTGVLADTPFYAVGGALGGLTGSPIGVSAGAFALEDSVRSVLVDLYKDGEIKSFGEFLDRLKSTDFSNAAKEGAKGAAVGATVGAVGKYSRNLANSIVDKYGLEGIKKAGVENVFDVGGATTALVSANSLLNSEVPTKDDFMEASGVILGLKGIHFVTNKTTKFAKDKLLRSKTKQQDDNVEALNDLVVNGLYDNYAKTGETPQQAVARIKENPTAINEIMGYPNKNEGFVIWNNKKLPVEFSVVDAKELKTSHDETGNKNPDFPSYLQNRERDRISSQEQINRISSNFIPELVIAGIDVQSGAPVITNEGFVVAGNGRVSAIKQAYAKGTEKDYREQLERLGFDTKEMENPILVRKLSGNYTEEQMENLVRESNTSNTMRLSKSETARDDATRIDETLLDGLNVDADLSSVENRKFIDSAFNKIVPEAERGALLDKEGKITNEAISRVNNALLANVVENERTLSKLIETEDPVLKKVGSGLAKSSPALTVMEKDISQGVIDVGYSLKNDINEALGLYERFKKSGQTISDFLNQGELLNVPNNSVIEIFKMFQSAKGANVIKDVFNEYARVANEMSGGFDFGIAEASKADIIKGAFERRTDKYNDKSFSNPNNLLDTFDENKPDNYFVASKGGKLSHGFISGISGFPDGEVRVYNSLLKKSRAVKAKENISRIEQLANNGYELIDFIDSVLENPSRIYKGQDKNSLFLLRTDQHNKGVAIRLEKNPFGDFYKVTSAYIVRGTYLKNKEQVFIDKENPVEEAPSPRQLKENVDQPRISDTGTDLNISSKNKEVKYLDIKNDEITDLLFGKMIDEAPKEGIQKSDIYLADKSMINVSFDGNNSNPVSLTDVVDNFKKNFDVAYRKGKMYKRGSIRGFYKTHAEVIRTRGHNDFSVIVHETAHHLDKVLFGDKQTLSEKERKDYISEFKRIASKGDTEAEGFAEFVSYFVTNPEFVEKKTPKFYKHFTEFMKKNEPDIMNVLEAAQKDYKTWRMQSSDSRIRGQISSGAKRNGLSVRRILDNLYTNLVDDLYPLKEMEREILATAKKRTGKDAELRPSQSPYILSRLNRGVGRKVDNYIEKYAFDTEFNKVGESYKDILKGLSNKELEELDTYLVAKRAIDLNKRGKETGIGTKDAEITVKNMEAKYGNRAKRIYSYLNKLLEYARDSGLLSDETLIKLKAIDPHYVPFQREMPTEKTPIARRLSPSQAIKRIKGSDLKITSPILEILNNTANIIANSDKNRILQTIVGLSEYEGSGKYIEKVQSMREVKLPDGTKLVRPSNRGELELILSDSGDSLGKVTLDDSFWIRKNADNRTEITVLNDGKPNVYEVAPEIANLVNGLNVNDLSLFTKILAAPAKLLRTGATLTPEFQIKNIIRDTLEAFINSKEGFKPLKDSLSGLGKKVFKTKDSTEWEIAGGAMANFIPRDSKLLHKKIKTINRNYRLLDKTGYLDSTVNTFKTVNPITYSQIVSELSEDATRLGQYSKAKDYYLKRGFDEYDAKIAAAFSSREATLDFARIGAKMRALNATTAFLNAGIQGTDKMARNLKNHPVKTSFALGVLMLPSLYLAFANKDDNDIKDLNGVIKDANWVFKSNGKIIKIAKPQNAVPFLSLFERALESNSDNIWSNMEDETLSLLEFNFYSHLPTVITPLVEVWRNKTSYQGIPLIPAYLEKLQPEYQFTSSTSETAKLISKYASSADVEASPIVIDQLVRDWGGGLGQYLLNSLDYVITGKTKEDIYEYEHTPFFRAFFVAYPTRGNSQSYKEFMEKSEDIQKKYDTAMYALKNGEVSKYNSYLNYAPILKYRKAVINIGKVQKEIADNTNLSVQEKRSQTDKLLRTMVDMCKQGNILIKDISLKMN